MRTTWVTIRRWSGRSIGLLLLPLLFLSILAPAAAGLQTTMIIVGGLWWLAILVWLVSVAGAWWALGELRWGILTPARRRDHLLSMFDQGLHASREYGISLVRVHHRYQYARQGTKCIVEHVDGTRQDAWFWHVKPRRHGVYLVRGSGGYGPHTHAMNVMFIGSRTTGHGILWSLPRGTWRAARRRSRSVTFGPPHQNAG